MLLKTIRIQAQFLIRKIDAYNSLIEVTEHFAKIIRRLNDGYELIGESIVNVDKLLEYLLINISNIN